MSASGAFVICQGDPSQSCCWEQCILDAGCTCGKWLFGMGLLEPRIMHAGCRVHLRKVAFDDAAGAKEQCMLDAGCARGERLLTLRGVEEQCIVDAEGTCGKLLLMAPEGR